jgi:hypothetical protein
MKNQKDWQVNLFIDTELYIKYKTFLWNRFRAITGGHFSILRPIGSNLMSEVLKAVISGQDINPRKIIEEYIKNKKELDKKTLK